MAGSYLIDVFRGTVAPDRNLGRVALFLGYFPQIMEGPICRYGQTADALMAGEPVTRPNLYAGSLRMLWGLAKKMIVADRLNAFVKPVFADYTSYDGTVIAVAAVLYTLQLYCDFSGTMDVALGMSPYLQRKPARELPPARSSRAPPRGSGSAGTSPWALGCVTTFTTPSRFPNR